MKLITDKIHWIMIATGVITCSMFLSLFSPERGLNFVFGTAISGDIVEVVVRNWGALIGIVGALLIYGAVRPHSRDLILVLAIVSKSIFIGLILLFGKDYLASAGGAVVFDALAIVLYCLYLFANRANLKI